MSRYSSDKHLSILFLVFLSVDTGVSTCGNSGQFILHKFISINSFFCGVCMRLWLRQQNKLSAACDWSFRSCVSQFSQSQAADSSVRWHSLDVAKTLNIVGCTMTLSARAKDANACGHCETQRVFMAVPVMFYNVNLRQRSSLCTHSRS